LAKLEGPLFSEVRKVEYRDHVWRVLVQIKTSRMTQFLEKGRATCRRRREAPGSRTGRAGLKAQVA